jgi:hypothetical protein
MVPLIVVWGLIGIVFLVIGVVGLGSERRGRVASITCSG